VSDNSNHRIRLLTPVRAAASEITGGNRQSGPAGTQLPQPLTVRVNSQDGAPLPGITVTFSATPNTAVLSAPRAVTNASGVASTNITLPAQPGPVTVTAAVEGLPNLTFTLTAEQVVVVSPSRPMVNAVVGLSAFGGGRVAAPGGWLEIYGVNLARETREWSGSDFEAGRAPTTLAGVRVLVNNVPAFVQLASPTQLNVVVPAVAAGMGTLQVTNEDGESASVAIEIAARAPALLAPPEFRSGGRQYAVAFHSDRVFVGREGLVPGAAFREMRAGDRIVLFGIGFGDVTPAVAPGQIPTGASSLAGLTIELGGRAVALEYGGLAPGLVGIYQFNLVVPEGLSGDVPLTVRVGGTSVNQMLFLTAAAL
jgi:uncharacterized protein (TIGR03437 family)